MRDFLRSEKKVKIVILSVNKGVWWLKSRFEVFRKSPIFFLILVGFFNFLIGLPK